MSIFSTESKLYKGITLISHIVVLNFCWLVASLPIFTIGVSTIAAYDVIFKIMDDKEGYVFKNFWKAFKSNFKQGVPLSFITLLAGYAFYLDAQLLTKGDPSALIIIISIVTLVTIVFALLYVYPLCARYDNKIYLHIRNSFLLSIRYFGKTMFALLIVVFEIGVMIWNEKTIILVVLVGPLVLMFTIAGVARKIFQDMDRINANEAKMAALKAEDEEAIRLAREAELNAMTEEQKAELKAQQEAQLADQQALDTLLAGNSTSQENNSTSEEDTSVDSEDTSDSTTSDNQ